MSRMYRPFSAVLLLSSCVGMVGTAMGQADSPFIHAATGPAEPGAIFAMSKDQLAIKARGKWVERLKRGPHSPILPTNAVEIQCSRKNMSCDELRAEAGKPRDDVSLTRRSFTVTEWTPQRILARSDTDSADLMLRIYPAKQRVELSYWDTKPQHERVGPADGWVWELE